MDIEELDFEKLEIVCEGNGVHTGADVKVFYEGENIVAQLRLLDIIWTMNSGDCSFQSDENDTGLLTFWYYPEGSDKAVSYKTRKPIKKFDISFKNARLVTDNYRENSRLYIEGKDMTEILGIAFMEVAMGDASTISEMEIVFA